MGQAEHNITGIGVRDGNVNGRKIADRAPAGFDATKMKAPPSLEEKMGLFAKCAANCDETANLEYDDQS
jgi:hypothetical protein